MSTGAHTPEDLEALLEDTFVVCDRTSLAGLIEEAAVVAVAGNGHESRGSEAIVRAMAEAWSTGHTYLAGVRRVLQARETALVVSESGIHVVRRGSDKCWRLAISLLYLESSTRQEDA